jgi:hypothetical protein
VVLVRPRLGRVEGKPCRQVEPRDNGAELVLIRGVAEIGRWSEGDHDDLLGGDSVLPDDVVRDPAGFDHHGRGFAATRPVDDLPPGDLVLREEAGEVAMLQVVGVEYGGQGGANERLIGEVQDATPQGLVETP